MLPSHGRYSYHPWPERPVYSWPGGAKLAVYLGINLEHFAFGEGLGAELAPGPNGGGGPQPDVLNYAWRDYGNRVGAWRLIELLEALRLPATVLVNSAMYGYAPSLIAAHRARGDEIAAHGRTNSERQSTMDEAAERAMIRAATTVITEAEGAPPRGWLSPWIAESRVTPDLLAEAGYSYTLNWCADDQPIHLATRTGPLLAVPYPQEVNDMPSIVARKDSAEQFAAMIVADFEERLLQIRDGKPQVMGIALHPHLIGQPYRLRALRGALEHITARQGLVWLTTAGQIASHVARLPGMLP
ncbi:polysaccharide deacetylase family protein [Teichococcus vastitatis]|uniref:Chitooligosaccharide deacetylase n=1 Tax=Teichococcus vastitatis TaxID=2307076 RepID=A0ABS9W0C1_9PROT|nr:polysaccharide deacetylase family protein [Pseudoroseomonas vastitatis]MCI0752642.1 polysaccharide deacetylase family protein [Pseudoroseomonas vastitatis]